MDQKWKDSVIATFNEVYGLVTAPEAEQAKARFMELMSQVDTCTPREKIKANICPVCGGTLVITGSNWIGMVPVTNKACRSCGSSYKEELT